MDRRELVSRIAKIRLSGTCCILFCGIARIFCGSAALAQTAPLPEPPIPTIRSQSTLVQVPALVTSKGQVVYTLKADDFTVTDDGVPQKVSLDELAEGQPFALVVVVETGGAGGRQLDKYRALGPLIETLVGNVSHKVAVVEFDSQPNLLLSFTQDLDHVSRVMGKLEEADGGAAIFDGLGLAVDLLKTQPPQYRRAILLISETVDHGSKLSVDDALRVISDTNTAIYSLAFSSSRAEAKHAAVANLPHSSADAAPGPPGGCMAQDPDNLPDPTQTKAKQALDCAGILFPPLLLIRAAITAAVNGLRRNVPETVSRVSGGEYFNVDSVKGLQRDLLTMSNHISNRYLLSFQPSAPRPGLHVLGVQLKDYEHLTVAARREYWVDEQQDAPAH